MDFTERIGKVFDDSGFWREAAKIDKLLKDWERTNPENKTPKLEEALFALQQLVKENPQVDGILPWIWQRLKKRELDVDAEGNVAPTEEYINKMQDLRPEEVAEGEEPDPPQPMSVIHIADWFADKNSPTRQGVDIMQLSPSEVEEKVEQWDEELATKKDKEQQHEESQGQGVLYTFEDGSYLRQVQSAEESIELGKNTGNCLRDSRSYFDNSAIIEYVNSEGKQEVAIEIAPRPGAEKLPNGLNDPRGGIIKQIQAKRGQSEEGGYYGNKLPTEEVQRKLREFFQSVKVDDRPMVQGQRARMISEPKDMSEFRSWIDAGKPQEFRIHDMGEDFVLPDDEWQKVYDEKGPNAAQTGYIGTMHNGIPSETASAIFQLPISGGEVTRGTDPPQWNAFVKHIATEAAQNPDEAVDSLKEVYEALVTEEQLERFQEALHEELPELERIFYENLYYEPKEGIEEDDVQAQFKRWPLVQGFGNDQNPFGPLFLTRGSEKESIEPPLWSTIPPNQLELPDMPPVPDRHPIFSHRKRNRKAQKRPQQQKKAVYYRWSFDPKRGVALSNNETRYGSRNAAAEGYAYRIGNGWRLTDREHRPVEDAYVASEVARKLKNK